MIVFGGKSFETEAAAAEAFGFSPAIFCDILRLIPRNEVVKMFNCKTVKQFTSFVKRNPDFPKPIRFTKYCRKKLGLDSFFYSRQEIGDWLNQKTVKNKEEQENAKL